MSDHTFEIQLFLAGTAIAVLGVAVTQADWKHKAFVRSLFGLAFVLFGAAVFWPQIGPQIPQAIDAPLGAISSSSSSWLLLLGLAVSAICGLDYRARLEWLKKY